MKFNPMAQAYMDSNAIVVANPSYQPYNESSSSNDLVSDVVE